MQSYQKMSKEELLEVKEGLEKEYAKFQGMGLSLNMARGKPAAEQLDFYNANVRRLARQQ